MANRKTYGNIVFGTAFVLAILMLAGVIAWKHDWSNVFLGVSVFVLYGMGQWLSVLYWHNIQKDWEDTGVVLAKLQQAVSDIPAALDSNLKSIATRLTEGQAQALEKLQGQVNEGARITLEKGATQIGDSLDKNMKQPLAALEAKLQAWTKNAESQTESARALGEEIRRTQREGAEQAQRLAEGLSVELKSLAGSQAAQADRLLSAWAERAAASQADAESKLTALHAALIEDVTSRLQAAQAAQGEAQERILQKALNGVEAQARASQEAVAGQVNALNAAATEQTKALQSATADQTASLKSATAEQIRSLQAALAEQAKAAQAAADTQALSLQEAAEAFTKGLSELKESSLQLVRDVEAKASSSLEAQSQLSIEIAGKVSDLADRMRQGSEDVAELAHVAQINQTEMQAGVAMLNSGLSSILERLETQAQAGEGYQTLLAELGKTLSDFQDRSAEVLVENALKTQEILMEVLRNQEGRAPSESTLAAAQ